MTPQSVEQIARHIVTAVLRCVYTHAQSLFYFVFAAHFAVFGIHRAERRFIRIIEIFEFKRGVIIVFGMVVSVSLVADLEMQKESISQWHENRKQQRNKYQGLPF